MINHFTPWSNSTSRMEWNHLSSSEPWSTYIESPIELKLGSEKYRWTSYTDSDPFWAPMNPDKHFSYWSLVTSDKSLLAMRALYPSDRFFYTLISPIGSLMYQTFKTSSNAIFEPTSDL